MADVDSGCVCPSCQALADKLVVDAAEAKSSFDAALGVAHQDAAANKVRAC